MLDLLGGLPGPQRDAAGVAFGLRPGPAPEPFLLGLAVLSLVSAAAAERPLLCVVDDAHWLDPASAQILAFAARRLPAAPAGWCSVPVITRTGSPGCPNSGCASAAPRHSRPKHASCCWWPRPRASSSQPVLGGLRASTRRPWSPRCAQACRPVDSGRQVSPARPSRSAPSSPPASSAPSTAPAPATPAWTAWPGSSSDSPPPRSSSPSPAVGFAPSASQLRAVNETGGAPALCGRLSLVWRQAWQGMAAPWRSRGGRSLPGPVTMNHRWLPGQGPHPPAGHRPPSRAPSRRRPACPSRPRSRAQAAPGSGSAG